MIDWDGRRWRRAGVLEDKALGARGNPEAPSGMEPRKRCSRHRAQQGKGPADRLGLSRSCEEYRAGRLGLSGAGLA